MDISATTEVLRPQVGMDDLAPGSGPGPVDASASTRFDELMGGPDKTGAIDAASAVDGARAPSPGSLGDRILHGLQRVSTEMNETWKRVADISKSKDMRVTDMISVQMHMINMSINAELVSKAVSRTTQNVDQLVKLQ